MKQHIILLGVLSLLTGILAINIYFYAVPERDFFEYTKNARNILNGSFVQGNWASPPLYGLGVVALGHFITNPYHNNIEAGVSLNIFLLIVSVYLLYVLVRPYLRIWTFVLLACILTNPLTYYVTLQPINMLFFTVFVLGVMVLFDRKYLRTACLLSGLSYLVRFDGISLSIALFITLLSLKYLNRRTFLPIVLLLAGIPIVWEILVFFATQYRTHPFFAKMGGQIITNLNMQYISHSLFQIPFFLFSIPEWVAQIGSAGILLYIAIGVLKHLKYPEKAPVLFAGGIFTVTYGIMQILYTQTLPRAPHRYTYPILWSIYLFMLWPLISSKKANTTSTFRICILVILTAACIHNASLISRYVGITKTYDAQYKYAGDWINNKAPQKPISLVGENSRIAKYFITDTHSITIFDTVDTPAYACTDASCIAKYVDLPNTNEILYIKQNSLEYWSAGFTELLEVVHLAELPASSDYYLIDDMSPLK